MFATPSIQKSSSVAIAPVGLTSWPAGIRHQPSAAGMNPAHSVLVQSVTVEGARTSKRKPNASVIGPVNTALAWVNCKA